MTALTSRRWRRAGIAALALLSTAFLTFAVSVYLSPRNDVPAADSVDAGFARDMAVHHQQAVEMSFLVRDRTEDEDVRRLAYDIVNTQANQRGMLLGRLDTWKLPKTSSAGAMAWMGHSMEATGGAGMQMPGMVTDAQLEQLTAAKGQEAEILYLRLMTAHHKAGVDMAQAALSMGEDEQLRSLARSMVRGQRSEITLMTGMLAERTPEGSRS